MSRRRNEALLATCTAEVFGYFHSFHVAAGAVALSAVANFGQKMVIRYQKPICLIQQMQESERRSFRGWYGPEPITWRWCQLCSASADWRMEPNRCLSLTRRSHFYEYQDIISRLILSMWMKAYFSKRAALHHEKHPAFNQRPTMLIFPSRQCVFLCSCSC